jgi:hypothetical protein
MFEAFFIPSILTLLVLLSIVDYKTHSVKISALFLFWGLSSLYALFTLQSLVSLASLVYLGIIFVPLVFFGLGAGDVVILTGLWPFLQPIDSMWIFLVLFMFIWCLVVMVVYWMDRKEFKTLKDFFVKKSIPLIPVITLAFIVFLFL